MTTAAIAAIRRKKQQASGAMETMLTARMRVSDSPRQWILKSFGDPRETTPNGTGYGVWVRYGRVEVNQSTWYSDYSGYLTAGTVTRRDVREARRGFTDEGFVIKLADARDISDDGPGTGSVRDRKAKEDTTLTVHHACANEVLTYLETLFGL